MMMMRATDEGQKKKKEKEKEKEKKVEKKRPQKGVYIQTATAQKSDFFGNKC